MHLVNYFVLGEIMFKKLKCNSGISFLELLFAISILSIIFIFILPLISSIKNINKNTEYQYRATLLAQSYMDQIKASETVETGQTTEFIEDAEIIINISEIDEYEGDIYKVTIEVIIEGNTLEKLEGYKIIKE